MYAHSYVYIYIYIHIDVHTYIHIHIIHMYIHMCVHIYIYIYLFIYLYAYLFIHMHIIHIRAVCTRVAGRRAAGPASLAFLCLRPVRLLRISIYARNAIQTISKRIASRFSVQSLCPKPLWYAQSAY